MHPIKRCVASLDSWNEFPENRDMPLTREQALDYFRSDDLIGLGMEADAVRKRLS